MRNLSASGANYIRVWLTNSWNDMFLETRLGNYSLPNAYHIDALLSMAEANGIRVMLTTESFNLFCTHKSVRSPFPPAQPLPPWTANRHNYPRGFSCIHAPPSAIHPPPPRALRRRRHET